MSRSLRGVIAALLLLLAAAAASAGDAPAPAGLQAAATLVVRSGAASTLRVDIVNPRPETLRLRVVAQVMDARGRAWWLPRSADAPAVASAPRGMTRWSADADLGDAALPLRGFVALEPDAPGPAGAPAVAVLPLSIDTQGWQAGAASVSGGTLLVVLLLVGAAWHVRRKTASQPLSLGDAMGQPTWDLTKSFASNLAFVGGIVGVALATTAMPDQLVLASRKTYVGLNIVFSAVIAVAPFAFLALANLAAICRRPTPAANGTVFTFLTSSTLTAWGALGQVAVLIAVFREMGEAGSMSMVVVIGFEVLLGLLAAGLLVYVPSTITSILREQEQAEPALVVQAAEANVIAAPAAVERRETRGWRLL